eukprot:10461642-Ditylum_brightwellii.AAC.1
MTSLFMALQGNLTILTKPVTLLTGNLEVRIDSSVMVISHIKNQHRSSQDIALPEYSGGFQWSHTRVKLDNLGSFLEA